MARSSRLTAIVGLTAAMALWIAPQASAAITGSHIDTPSGTTFGIVQHDPLTMITVSGTTTGGNPGTDQVDIACTNADGTDIHVAEFGVATAPNGTFSTEMSPASFNYEACILRAIPAGTTPADVSSFTGPLVMFGDQNTYSFGGGPTLYDYYVWVQQHTGAFDYQSVSSCGVCDGYLLNSNLDQTARTFFENDFLGSQNSNDSPTRSELRVDGVDAYPPAAAQFINSGATSGFPAFSYDVSQNPSNGDTTITEHDQIVKCGADTSYPPDATKCATFVDTGVRLDRTILQDHDGHLVTVTDTWVSTDNASHSLDLLPQNDQLFFHDSATADPSGVAYQFPGESGYSTHAFGDVVNFGDGSPGTVYIKRQGSPEDATGEGQGAIVFDRPADPATFNVNSVHISIFHFHQTATVPMNGLTTFRTAYAQAYTCAEVASLAQAAAASFGGSAPSPCPSSGGGGGSANPTPSTTGQRAAALKKCKKKHSKKARKKCRKKAKRLPV